MDIQEFNALFNDYYKRIIHLAASYLKETPSTELVDHNYHNSIDLSKIPNVYFYYY